jgi:hypothetical protein
VRARASLSCGCGRSIHPELSFEFALLNFSLS